MYVGAVKSDRWIAIHDAKTFFKSTWFIELYPGKVDPDSFIRKLEKDGMYMRCLNQCSYYIWQIHNSKSETRVANAKIYYKTFEKFFGSKWFKDHVGISKKKMINDIQKDYEEKSLKHIFKASRKKQTV